MAPVKETEFTGYQYRDVVTPAKYNPFKYLSQNPDTKFSIMAPTSATLKFEFFDMKYLSNTIDFTTVVTDSEIFTN